MIQKRLVIVLAVVLVLTLGTKPVMASCVEECPSTRDGVLRSCTPADSDGTSQDSLCNWNGRREMCGYQWYVCPKAGGTWVLENISTPTLMPTPTLVPVNQTYQNYKQSSDYVEFLEFRQFLRWKYGWIGVVRDDVIR